MYSLPPLVFMRVQIHLGELVHFEDTPLFEFQSSSGRISVDCIIAFNFINRCQYSSRHGNCNLDHTLCNLGRLHDRTLWLLHANGLPHYTAVAVVHFLTGFFLSPSNQASSLSKRYTVDYHGKSKESQVCQTCTLSQHRLQERNSSYFAEICTQISCPTGSNPARNGVGFRCSGSAVHALFDQIIWSEISIVHMHIALNMNPPHTSQSDMIPVATGLFLLFLLML